MLNFLKSLFGNLLVKTEEKVIMDSKLGKLTNTYTSKDQFFFWCGEIKLRNYKEKTEFTIDGNMNAPFDVPLQKAYYVIDRIADLEYDIQKQLDSKFADKKINLSRDFSLQDISFYYDEETKENDYDFEYYNEDSSIMISVNFIEDKIDEIDFY